MLLSILLKARAIALFLKKSTLLSILLKAGAIVQFLKKSTGKVFSLVPESTVFLEKVLFLSYMPQTFT